MSRHLLTIFLILLTAAIVFNFLTGGSFFRSIRQVLTDKGYIKPQISQPLYYQNPGEHIDIYRPVNTYLVALALIGGAALIVSTTWLLILALMESIPWFFACILLPPLLFVFGLWHYEQTQTPTLLLICSLSMLAMAGCLLVWLN